MATVASHTYLDPKTLDKIKRLDVRARLVVEGFITGQHRSPYNGFAVEFASHREYTPGDDIKHIDWKVWSKTDRLYIKEYEEETNLKCTILLDCSKSNKLEKNLPASSHPSHLKLMLHEMQNTKPHDKSDIGTVFVDLARQIRRRGMIVLVSDLFVDPATLVESLRQFRLRKHEVIVFHVMHEDEWTFPFQDNTLFRGLEDSVQLHTEPRALRRSYLEAVERFLDQTRRTCAGFGIDYVLMSSKDPLDAALAGYLAFRQKTRRQIRGR